MSGQRFIARESTEFPNGAIGWGDFKGDYIGPWAKVQHCPIDASDQRRTVYATEFPNNHYSIRARCTLNGKTVLGDLIIGRPSPIFVPDRP